MWNAETRTRYDRKGLRYSSDLTDAEWELVAPLIPPAKRGGRRRTVEVRAVLDAVLYVLENGCKWRCLPEGFPPRSTVHGYLQLWAWDGTLERLHHELYVRTREHEGREASPTAAVIDSQSVRSAEKDPMRRRPAGPSRVWGSDFRTRGDDLMEIAPASATPVAQGQRATLFVALELSKATWLVGMHSPLADKISQHRLAGGDVEALLALITRLQERAEATLGQPVAVVCCYEAGYDGFWLHRWLQAHSITNHVLDAASVLVDRRARRAKTDRLDLVSLLRTLMAWHRGEHQVCRMVRVPSPEQEDRRRQTRERERLVKERVQHLGRIKGLLMTQGIRDFEPTRRDWQNRLDQLRTGDGRVLAPCLKAEIERECQRLGLVMEMIGAVEAERDARPQDDAAQPAAGAVDPTSQLVRLKGVGATIAGVLMREVFYRTFANRRQVASYLGLTPSPWCSGAVRRDQGISKAGNPRARQVAIELAWLWLRHQPTSALAQWFHQRTGTTKGRLRRILVVALARKLMIALWRYLTDGVVPEGAMTKA